MRPTRPRSIETVCVCWCSLMNSINSHIGLSSSSLHLLRGRPLKTRPVLTWSLLRKPAWCVLFWRPPLVPILLFFRDLLFLPTHPPCLSPNALFFVLCHLSSCHAYKDDTPPEVPPASCSLCESGDSASSVSYLRAVFLLFTTTHYAQKQRGQAHIDGLPLPPLLSFLASLLHSTITLSLATLALRSA